MENLGFTEQDWQLFKKRIGGWQEHFMDTLNKEYVYLLQQDKLPSEKFWELEKRVNFDKSKSGVVADLRRSNMLFIVSELLRDKVIDLSHITDFSDEFKESIQYMIGGNKYAHM